VRHQIEEWMAHLPEQWPSGTGMRSGTMVYRLSGPEGGSWSVRIDEGKLTAAEGEVDSPTAILEASAEDFAAIVRGELEPMAAYFAGRVRVLGDASFAAEVYSRLGQTERGEETVRTDTSGWYQFRPLPIDYSREVASDASDLLDAPAGKHGFLTAKGGRFVFQDGSPTRFWGTNIVAGNVFMDHETARKTAARLARFGCNMVRLHHMDASWAQPNIFDNSYDDTQHLSAESLDRLDYLIHQLKQHGIYVYLDLLVHRKFKAGDGVRDWEKVDNGAKIVAHYNPRLIELQRKYAHDLYTHVNKYTGLRYCDDPAIALSEIINESSLFWAGGYGSVPPSYLQELDRIYQEWARGKGLPLPEGASAVEGLRADDPRALEFLYDTQVSYFTEMRDYLRSIGVRIPLAGSNHWEAMALDLKSNLALDYLDRHGYWDHPQGGYGPQARFDDLPMVKSKGWNLPVWFSGQRALGKPIIITEWNSCWINEYIAEGPLLLAAYGAYQDWDGLLQFDYAGAEWADLIEGNFDIGNKPQVFATWPAAARLFLLQQVRPGGLAETRLTESAAAGGAQITENLPDRAGLRRRLAFSFGQAGEPGAVPELPPLDGPAVSDTRELSWDGDAGLVIVNAPTFSGRIGFASGPVQAGPAVFDLRPGFAVVAVTALDGRSIADSGHLLITATARAENTGMVYKAGKKSAADAGGPPILVEPVRGKVAIALQGRPASAAAYALDAVGVRQAPVDAVLQGSLVAISLEADAFWYELVISR